MVHAFTGKVGDIQDGFFVMATRTSFGQFKFESRFINETNYQNINYISDNGDLTNHGCLTAKFNKTSKRLDLYTTDCFEKHLILCRKVRFVKPNCSTTTSAFTNLNPFSIMLNPDLKLHYHRAIAYQKAEVMSMFKRLDLKKSYESIFQTLWYSSLPCFSVINITRTIQEMALVKNCEWRGIPVACSQIFSTFPTDEGLCCSFNMKAAEDIYRKSIFRDNLQTIQSLDKKNALIPIPPSTTYLPNNKPQAGANRGLRVVLDAHSDWLYQGSYDEDFYAFTAVIHPRESFPLINQGGLIIRPGHYNTITLTSSIINADNSIKSLNKEERNCLFPEETSDLKLHKKYSYENCKFECAFSYAKKEVYNRHRISCQPWFFPTENESSTICDPWISKDFFDIISKNIPDSLCSQCRPDCNSTFYESSVLAVPFKVCDSSSLGVSQFCQLKYEQPLLKSVIFQIVKEYTDINEAGVYLTPLPGYLPTASDFSRGYGYNIFNKTPLAYDVFDRDIALVEIIYQKPTLIQIESQLMMSWIDYFSIIGGLFGLVLGMGFYSFFDVIWLGLRIVAKYLKFTNWIA